MISLFIDGADAQFRKFATLPAWQGRGAGSLLLQKVFDHSQSVGVTRLWCRARTGAQGLYGRFGMVAVGDEVVEEGVSYRVMERRWG